MTLVVTLAALPFVLVVHELGHLLAAWIMKASGVHVRIRRLTVSVVADIDGARRQAAFIAAGPAASVVAGCAGVACGGAAAVVGVVSVLFGVVSLVPHGTSDGARLLALLRNDASDAVR